MERRAFLGLSGGAAAVTLPDIERDLARLDELDDFHRRLEEAELCRGNLREFVQRAWSIAEPDPVKTLISNWHIDAICEHLQAVAEGKIRWLLIGIGPGYGKSLLSSVLFSSWLWARNPRTRIMAGTYTSTLTERDNIKARAVIESTWYQKTFIATLPKEEQWRLVKRNEDYLQNDKAGFRMALSVDGKGTGLRGDGQILDDILNVGEASSEPARRRARNWVFETMSSRFDNMEKGWRVAIGQRLHEDDPYGHMLATGRYEHLMLPSEFEPNRRARTSIGFSDPRTQQGELLFPALFSRDVIEQAKVDLRAAYAGQHQQRPAPAGGGMFKQYWWRFWQYPGMTLPAVKVGLGDGTEQEVEPVYLPDLQERGQSWDCAFKHTADSDFVVGQCWGRRGADRFLLDQVRARMNFPETVKAINEMSKRHPLALTKLVEDKANGPAIIDFLRHGVPGLVGVTPEGGKEARAAISAKLAESQNIYLPHPTLAPWVWEFIEEHNSFPVGSNDDMVDSCSQQMVRWSAATSGPVVNKRIVPDRIESGSYSDRSWMS